MTLAEEGHAAPPAEAAEAEDVGKDAVLQMFLLWQQLVSLFQAGGALFVVIPHTLQMFVQIEVCYLTYLL